MHPAYNAMPLPQWPLRIVETTALLAPLMQNAHSTLAFPGLVTAFSPPLPLPLTLLYQLFLLPLYCHLLLQAVMEGAGMEMEEM